MADRHLAHISGSPQVRPWAGPSSRDRFADLIIAHESPLGTGITGWVVDHCEAVLANQAHLDPRSIQVPGTPFEPESMIVIPLLVNGEAIGTLNTGRVSGILEATRLGPGSLELEITESVVMDQSEAGIRTLRRLRETTLDTAPRARKAGTARG